MDKLFEAKNNLYKCTCCGKTISKGEKYFRDAMQSWKKSHTVNICYRCIIKLYLRLNVDEKEVGEIRKEMILEKM